MRIDTLNFSSVFNNLEENDHTEDSTLNSNQQQHISKPDGADYTSKLDPGSFTKHIHTPVVSPQANAFGPVLLCQVAARSIYILTHQVFFYAYIVILDHILGIHRLI